MTTPEIREQFIEEYLDEAKHSWTPNKNAIREILHGIEDNQELVEKTMAGFQKLSFQKFRRSDKGLTDLVESDYPFAIDQCQTCTSHVTHLLQLGMRYH